MKPSNPISAELLRIANNHGGILQPLAVVNAAREESSPLHSSFEWDDTAAAEQYRLAQARQLIRVSVQIIGTPDGDVVDRVFVSLGQDRLQDGGGYRQLSVVLSDGNMRAQLLNEALAELEVFQKKYAQLKQLADLFAAMKQATAKNRKKAA